MSKDLDQPPADPVWWYITDRTGKPAYTKTRLWFDARRNFGGDCVPTRVVDADVIRELEESRKK